MVGVKGTHKMTYGYWHYLLWHTWWTIQKKIIKGEEAIWLVVSSWQFSRFLQHSFWAEKHRVSPSWPVQALDTPPPSSVLPLPSWTAPISGSPLLVAVSPTRSGCQSSPATSHWQCFPCAVYMGRHIWFSQYLAHDWGEGQEDFSHNLWSSQAINNTIIILLYPRV